MTRRPVDWDRRNAEQEVQVSARALHALHAFRFTEARDRAIAAHAKYADAVEPAARAMWTPANIRAIAGWLNTLADELDEGTEKPTQGELW